MTAQRINNVSNIAFGALFVGQANIRDQINKKIIAPLASANKLSDFPDFNDYSGQE